MNSFNNKAKPNDFFIDLDAVGTFRFNRKSYGGQVRIDTEMVRILGANFSNTDSTMHLHALLISNYNALMVECPDGWRDLEEIDLSEDPTLDDKILELYFALRSKLDSFRLRTGPAGTAAPGEGAGNGAVSDDGVLAAPEVQPAAD